jgi:hypothetical protein
MEENAIPTSSGQELRHVRRELTAATVQARLREPREPLRHLVHH